MSRDNYDKNKIRRRKVSSSKTDVTKNTSKNDYKKVSSKPKKHRKRSQHTFFWFVFINIPKHLGISNDQLRRFL